MLIVPSEERKNVRREIDWDTEEVSLDNDELVVERKVSVIKGEWSGLAGEIASSSHRTYVVISVHGVFTASVKLPKSYLKLIK